MAGRGQREFPLGAGDGLPGDGLAGRPAADVALAGQQDQAVDGQEHGGEDGLAEDHPEQVLEDQADEADRDGGQDDHPGQALVGRAELPPAGARGWPGQVPQGAEEPADHPHPVPPEVDEQRDRRGHVQADDEREVRGLGLGHVEIARPATADQGRDQDVVPEAGHREQLGHALDEADHGGLQVGQVNHARPFAMLRCRIIVRLARGAGGGGAGQDPAGKRPRSRRTARTNFYKTVEHYQVRGGGRADTGSRGSGEQGERRAGRKAPGGQALGW